MTKPYPAGSTASARLRAAGARLEWAFGPIARAVQTVGEPPDRSRRPRPLGIDVVAAFDIVLTLLLFVTGYGEFDHANLKLPDQYPTGTLVFLTATMTLPLLLRDRRPGLALTLAMMANLWSVGAARDVLHAAFLTSGVIAVLYCLYTVAARYQRRVTTFAWAVCLVIGFAFEPRDVIGILLLVTAPALLGVNVRARRQVQHELTEQQHRHQEERAVLEERQRIARELHDVVAHHMSVIAISAEAAPYKVANPPEELRESFDDIRSSALEGLTELRRILGVLRTEPGPQTAPQPGLELFEEVVGSARRGGLSIKTTVIGRPRTLPQGMSLSAYRILQEALSNAMKHAPGARVSVQIRYEPSALTLRVGNGPGSRPGKAPSPVAETGGGHGLVGMRERVAMLDGELRHGPTSEGGFTLFALLPYPAADAAPDPDADPAPDLGHALDRAGRAGTTNRSAER